MKNRELKEHKENDFSDVEFLISDWDGTLVDSMPHYTTSFTRVMSDLLGIKEEDSKAFFSETTGQPLSKQITECAKKFAGQTVQDTLPLEDRFWDNLRDIKPAILEGAKDFLQQIKDKGIKVVVWSGTRTDVLRTNIELLGLSVLVEFAIGNEPGSKEKVKGPGLLKEIAKKFGLTPEEFAKKSLVIGDGIGDIQAGKNINAITAGYTRVKNTSLEASNADFFFNNYSQLLQKLKS